MGWRGEEWKRNACVARRSYASNGKTPPVGASVVRSGCVLNSTMASRSHNLFCRSECGEEWLGGPSWSPVGRGGAFFSSINEQTFTHDPQSTTKEPPTNCSLSSATTPLSSRALPLVDEGPIQTGFCHPQQPPVILSASEGSLFHLERAPQAIWPGY